MAVQQSNCNNMYLRIRLYDWFHYTVHCWIASAEYILGVHIVYYSTHVLPIYTSQEICNKLSLSVCACDAHTT